ncbi:MAG: hypothetical protein FJ316_07030 [SAR202 cluster bacterium]|nr:hypothetical protein [SAR202 cluster bacterium]
MSTEGHNPFCQADPQELGRRLQELAGQLTPFPAFMGMKTLQALELAPPVPMPDLGCVVVTPEGIICRLNLKMLTSAEEVSPGNYREELEELELPPGEYAIYAAAAIALLEGELRRRGLMG